MRDLGKPEFPGVVDSDSSVPLRTYRRSRFPPWGAEGAERVVVLEPIAGLRARGEGERRSASLSLLEDRERKDVNELPSDDGMLSVYECRLDVELLARSLEEAERWRDKLLSAATKVPLKPEPISLTASANREGETPRGYSVLTAKGVLVDE